jgi:hypothetical protein
MQTNNLNFYLYTSARRLLHQSRCLIPASLVQPQKQLDKDFAIGITTYIERYDKYFKPLYQSVSRYFPEVKITVSVNGHPKTEDQQRYLLRLQEELCSTAPPHHTFVLRDQAAGLGASTPRRMRSSSTASGKPALPRKASSSSRFLPMSNRSIPSTRFPCPESPAPSPPTATGSFRTGPQSPRAHKAPSMP